LAILVISNLAQQISNSRTSAYKFASGFDHFGELRRQKLVILGVVQVKHLLLYVFVACVNLTQGHRWLQNLRLVK
jgi:hypothetical protein